MFFDNLEKLCNLHGAAGRERIVAEEVLRQCKEYGAEAYIDNLGSVIAFKKGKKVPKNKIMLDAHLDEVAFILTSVTDEGFLRFRDVGGINPKVAIARRVTVGYNNLPGVIGTKPIHMQSDEEQNNCPEFENMYIDIGALDKDDALKHVRLGDPIYFAPNYTEYGDGMLVAKAIDDRLGCAVLLEVMQGELEYDTWFSFSTQEEAGGRGARATTYTIDPDVCVAVEATASGDVSGVEGANRVCVVGEGAVVSYMDGSTIYDMEMFDLAMKLGKEKNIKCQTKTQIAGGNNAGVIHFSRGGVRCIAVSGPSRYIHSPSDVVKKDDAYAVYEMVRELANTIGEI